MKILTILGTRPEIIRLSRIIPRLDEALGRENHILVHTGQNYDPQLSQVFFDELGLRAPDFHFNARGTFAEQLAAMFPEIERILLTQRPGRVLVLGDTNSALAAIVAARLRIPVYHMEAGNRSYSPSSPEEVNRRLVDHASSILLPYTERSRANLLAEGIHSSRVFVTGNPIWEVIQHYYDQIDASTILDRLELKRGKFFLVTLHREENVDDPERLYNFLTSLDALQRRYSVPIIVSTHPRIRQRLPNSANPNTRLMIAMGDNPEVRFLEPLGFFDFLTLTKFAYCVLSDSGTVQEECAILKIPNVTLRDYTERPEAMEVGASVLSGADPAAILRLVKSVTERRSQWGAPVEYLRTNVSEIVVRILLSHREDMR